MYALAALRAGATEVEVVHTFLELPQRPAVVTFTREQAAALEEQLSALARGVLNREFKVTDAPQRGGLRRLPGGGRTVLVAARDDPARGSRPTLLKAPGEW